MPNAKISAQDREAAAKRYAAYGQQVESYNAGIGGYNAQVDATNAANQALEADYNAKVTAYNQAIAGIPYIASIQGEGYKGWVTMSDGRTFSGEPGLVPGQFMIQTKVTDKNSPWYGQNKNTFVDTPPGVTKPGAAPTYAPNPVAPEGAPPSEPKGWNPSLAEIKNMQNPQTDMAGGEAAMAKGLTPNMGIVGANAERSKQLENPDEQPLTSNKGILARVLGGEL